MALRLFGTAAGIALCLVISLSLPDRVSADTSIVPLPVYATSRNGGNDYGFMPVFLFKENEYIYAIFAPSAIYNENTGLNLTLRYLGFPSVDKSYRIYFNRSLGVDHEATVEYWDNRHYEGRLRVFGRVSYFRDSTYRFFGLTEKSKNEDEVNYSNVELRPEASVGYYLNDDLVLSLRERFRWVTIRRGKLDKLPYIKSEFGGLDGLNGGAVLNSRLTLSYDTRDDEVFPGNGWYANLYGEANIAFSTKKPYTRIGFDARRYLKHFDKRMVTVLKAAAELTGGGDVPYFERSTIGGENTLRGFGTYRFTDDGYMLFNVEERIKMFKLHIYGVWSEWEAAPFVDVGRVYSSFGKGFMDEWQINPGIGFRAIVEPNVVGRVDFGYGEDGLATFVGLDFPF